MGVCERGCEPGRERAEVGAFDNPMGRVGDMRELANLAVYLLHPLSAYVNGQTVTIDGGGWNAGSDGFKALSAWGDAEWEQARNAIRGANDADRAKRTV